MLECFGRETQVMLAFLFQGAALLNVLCEFVIARRALSLHVRQNIYIYICTYTLLVYLAAYAPKRLKTLRGMPPTFKLSPWYETKSL